MKQFDHLRTDLERSKLIEASAGTGKTYAIASLYLRLLLEKRLQVHEILVVTFTEAATAELRNRIRRGIRKAIAVFGGAPAGDDFLARLEENTAGDAARQSVLADALHSFDRAAVFTIHGFCRKALEENAFESASPFDTELLTDQAALCEEITADFWRTNLYHAPASVALEALKTDLWNELIRLFDATIAQPGLRVIPAGIVPDFSTVAELESQAAKAKEAAAEIWARDGRGLAGMLRNDDGLKRNMYKPEMIDTLAERLDLWFDSAFVLPVPDRLEKYSPAGLAAGTKKNHRPPRHPLFESVEKVLQRTVPLQAEIGRSLLALKCSFVEYARRELPRRKRLLNVRAFDDLLLDMRAALEARRGAALSAALRSRFKAALIDEFQDTDPVQYEIFRTVFGGGSSLFLIGDPKQAIYGFRGADIFAYMKAAEEVKDRFTLSRNWRSAPRLIDAVNAVFRHRRLPFVFPEIRHRDSEAASIAEREELELEGEKCRAPLRIWFMPREDGSSPINKGEAESAVPEVVAGEIARLLNAGIQGRARIGARAVSPWDIAVLVRTNRQAEQMQSSLRGRRIPSVVYGAGSVFETEEALELARLLAAIADPGNEGKMKAALVTSIIGLCGDELARISEDESGWDERLRTFVEYRDLWAGRGFIAMARTLLAREGVRKRLLRFPDGERRLTDLLHCIELLQNAAMQERLGIEGLLKWFAAGRQGGAASADADAQQIRLETDEKALKIITVHKSKGLEFPIVFCPYLWSAVDPGTKGPAVFHDPLDKTTLIKDMGSEDLAEHRSIQGREALAEQCRLLYVALTRAKHLCCICWGAVKDAGLTAPAYLFHPDGEEGAVQSEEVRAHFESLGDDRLRRDLQALARDAGRAIEVLDMPPASPEQYLEPDSGEAHYEARRFSGRIARDWGAASFSAWTAGGPHAVEMPDRDTLPDTPVPEEEAAEEPAEERTIFGFPRGTRAGSCLHAVFEELDFPAAASPELEALVADKLERFGFERAWQGPVCRMVRNVLAAPLEDYGGDEIVLERLPRKRRLAELEFSFPLGRVTPAILRGVFEACPGAPVPDSFAGRLGGLGFSPLRGMMKGFIDLVFEWNGRWYLIDWKSNHLGRSPGAYGSGPLAAAMESSFYILQYHLYAVALHRYLGARLAGYGYEKHFGGVFYLFLRGIDPARGRRSGIYHDRPPEQRIARLEEALSHDR